MAVLVEAHSVVIRVTALLRAFDGDWEAFVAMVPNDTLCADGELARAGFMTPGDGAAWIALLEERGLIHLRAGRAVDLVMADPLHGPVAPCDWLQFGHMHDREAGVSVAAARLCGGVETALVTPPGWAYEHSLSRASGAAPADATDRGLIFLRHENGLDVYLDTATGKEVYVACGDTH